MHTHNYITFTLGGEIFKSNEAVLCRWDGFVVSRSSDAFEEVSDRPCGQTAPEHRGVV